MTPLKTIPDQESHLSSINPNTLDPVYNASVLAIRKAANVFDSLKESDPSSGTVIGDYVMSKGQSSQAPTFAQTHASRNQFVGLPVVTGSYQVQGDHNIFMVTPAKKTPARKSVERANAMVKAKVMSPPRALQKSVERTGFKGQVVVRRTNEDLTPYQY